MFTGLIEEIGRIVSVVRRNALLDITIEAHSIPGDLKTGDSVSISGVCLTVIECGDAFFRVQTVEETLKRSTLGRLKKGDTVNLERALRLGDRLGGHIVQGHIDETGRIVSKRESEGNVIIGIAPHPSLERYIAEKGSITVDGISLTVAYVKKGEFGVAVIPHTLANTTLAGAAVGDRVNLETDILSKYIEKLIGRTESLTFERLNELGFK